MAQRVLKRRGGELLLPEAAPHPMLSYGVKKGKVGGGAGEKEQRAKSPDFQGDLEGAERTSLLEKKSLRKLHRKTLLTGTEGP